MVIAPYFYFGRAMHGPHSRMYNLNLIMVKSPPQLYETRVKAGKQAWRKVTSCLVVWVIASFPGSRSLIKYGGGNETKSA